MSTTDFAYLDRLAVQYVTCEDEAIRSALRDQLWEGSAAFVRSLHLRCKLMTEEDVVQEIASQLGNMIDRFERSKGSYIGYIAVSAKQVVMNLYRDARPGGFSRRALEGANQIRELQTKRQIPLEEAQAKIFTKLGVGLLLQAQILEVLRAQDIPTSLNTPIGEDGITLEDTLVGDEEPACALDRAHVAVEMSSIPARYSAVIKQILDGVSGLHEITFHKPLSLAEKAICVDTALRLLKQKQKSA